jgi:hypothetical protein
VSKWILAKKKEKGGTSYTIRFPAMEDVFVLMGPFREILHEKYVLVLQTIL